MKIVSLTDDFHGIKFNVFIVQLVFFREIFILYCIAFPSIFLMPIAECLCS
jgi:hypothetical protein